MGWHKWANTDEMLYIDAILMLSDIMSCFIQLTNKVSLCKFRPHLIGYHINIIISNDIAAFIGREKN